MNDSATSPATAGTKPMTRREAQCAFNFRVQAKMTGPPPKSFDASYAEAKAENPDLFKATLPSNTTPEIPGLNLVGRFSKGSDAVPKSPEPFDPYRGQDRSGIDALRGKFPPMCAQNKLAIGNASTRDLLGLPSDFTADELQAAHRANLTPDGQSYKNPPDTSAIFEALLKLSYDKHGNFADALTAARARYPKLFAASDYAPKDSAPGADSANS